MERPSEELGEEYTVGGSSDRGTSGKLCGNSLALKLSSNKVIPLALDLKMGEKQGIRSKIMLQYCLVSDLLPLP